MGKTRDLFKKTGDLKGIFHARMDKIMDRKDNDYTNLRWQSDVLLFNKVSSLS